MFISSKNGQRIADELRAVISKEINIIDRDGTIIASTDKSRIGKIHSAAKKIVENNLDGLTVYADDSENGVKAGVNFPVSIDGEIQGVIGVTGRPEEIMIPGAVIKKMTELMIVNLRRQEEQTAAENARRLFFEHWLLSDNIDENDLAARAARENINLKLLRAVAAFDCADREHAGLTECVKKLTENNRQNFCFDFRSSTVLIFAGIDRQKIISDIETVAEKAEERLGAALSCGISLAEGKSMRACFGEAREALRVAARDKKRAAVYDESNLSFILRSLPEGLAEKLSSKLFADCPESMRGEIKETVRLFFNFGGDVDKMADAIFVHKNTIYYRIKQVKKLTGCSLLNPEESFLLYIACK